MSEKDPSLRAVSRRALCVVTALAVVVGLLPLPALAAGEAPACGAALRAGGLAAASAPKIRIMLGDESAVHRHMVAGDPSSSLALTAEATDGADADSCRWSSDDTAVATVSPAKGAAVTVSPAGEGVARVTAKAGEASDSCMVSVRTPVGPVAGVLKSAAEASLGGEDDATSSRGTLPAGTEVSVRGSCGGRWYVVAPDASAYPDGRSYTFSYIDKSKVRIPASSVTLSGAPAGPLPAGAAAQLSASVQPSLATDKKVAWSSSAPKVASVDQSGKVKALKPGSATIKAEAGGKSASVEVRVCSVGLSLSRTGSFSLAAGASERLSAKVVSDAAIPDARVTWSSSNAKVATVAADGTVRGVAAGSAVVSASGPYGSKASVKVRVLGTAKTPVAGSKAPKKPHSTKAKPGKKTKPKVKKVGAKSVTLKWKQVKGATGYRVQVKYKGKWRTAKTAKNKGKGKTAAKVTEFKAGKKRVKLEPGKKYAIRVVPLKGGKAIKGGTSSVKVWTDTPPDEVKRVLQSQFGNAIIYGDGSKTEAEMNAEVDAMPFTMLGLNDVEGKPIKVSPFAKWYLSGRTLYLHVYLAFEGAESVRMKDEAIKWLKKAYEQRVEGTARNFGKINFDLKVVPHYSNPAWDGNPELGEKQYKVKADGIFDAEKAVYKQQYVTVQCGAGELKPIYGDERSYSYSCDTQLFNVNQRQYYCFPYLRSVRYYLPELGKWRGSKTSIFLATAVSFPHEFGHCLCLDDAYTESVLSDGRNGVNRRESTPEYNIETDNCTLMDGVESIYISGKWYYKFTCHSNDLEMMLVAYRMVLDNEKKGSWQSFTNYRTVNGDESNPYTYIYYRSKAIRTPEGR